MEVMGMKKLKITILSACLLLSLVGCGKSEAAKSVDEKIQAIGTVTLDSDASITDAEEEYSKLSDKDRQQLEYYQTLVDARSKYDSLVEEEKAAEEQRLKDLVEEANKALDDLDMKKAYELAISLPDDYKDDADAIIKKVDSMCYKDTFFVKLENVTSSLPKSTDDPQKAISGGITYGHEYSSFDSMQTALSDYYKYLNSYFISTNNDGLSYDEYSMSAQTYEFENENGHKITVSGSNLFGMYFLNINIEENVNYRDVIESENEETK